MMLLPDTQKSVGDTLFSILSEWTQATNTPYDNVNNTSTLSLSRFPRKRTALLPSMVHRQSGKVIFISSIAGKVPIPFRSSFAASKHSLQAFADALRAEVALYHVKVLVSSPEYISMDLTADDICSAGTVNESKLKFDIISRSDPLPCAKLILRFKYISL